MLYKKLAEGIAGDISWHFIDLLYSAEKYIFFPSDDEECNKWGVLLLSDYTKKIGAEKIIVFVSNIKIKKELEKSGCTDVQVKKISVNQMKCYMSYYALIDMSDKWTVVSVTQPYRTGADRLLGIKNTTYKDIVYYDVYRFSEIN